MVSADVLMINGLLSSHCLEMRIMNGFRVGLMAVILGSSSLSALALDESAAVDLLKESNCFKCHAIGREKIGPSYNKIAEKYKGKPEALEKLTKHVTVPNEVEIDGSKEQHGQVKTSDPARVQNLVEWILSR
jgi:cytochrome c